MIDLFTNRTTVGTALTTTSEFLCYKCEVQSGNVTGIRATNKTGSTANLTLTWYDASATTAYTLLYQAPVQAGTHLYYPFEDGFALRQNDEIRATSGTAAAFDVIVTVIEPPGRLSA